MAEHSLWGMGLNIERKRENAAGNINGNSEQDVFLDY